MARQNSLITFTGKLGDVIGYERNGKFFLRRMPETVRQTTATRHAARRFGIASKTAGLIRNAFYGNLDIRCDNSHINRLNRMLIASGAGHTAITGFRFNQHTGTDRFFSVAPRLFRNGILHIPPQTLGHCKDITALEVKVIATRIDFSKGNVTGTETAIMMIDPHQYFAGADVSLDVSGTGTLIITLQIRGMLGDIPSGNRQYQAADIIAVTEPQIHRSFNKRSHHRAAGSQGENEVNSAFTPTSQYTIKRE